MEKVLKKLGERELDFCRYYVRNPNAKEAALHAGFPPLFAENRGLKLLEQPLIKKQVCKFRKNENREAKAEEALAGLARIANGHINDAVKLAFLPEDEVPNLNEWELYNISEFKRTKTGIEIKFFDRIKALETLFSMMQKSDGGNHEITAFYKALQNVAGQEKKEEHPG